MKAREEIAVVPATSRGRSILAVPEGSGPFPLVVGFHGYAESAEAQLARLRAMPPAERCALLSVQGLHWFYARSGEVVANWMTRLHREDAIADNLAWVASALAGAVKRFPWDGRLVWTGFSQGAAMAWRAAAFLEPPCRALIILGGDVPPDVADLGSALSSRVPAVLAGRGRTDALYPRETFDRDLATLHRLGVNSMPIEFDGAHEWNGEFAAAAGSFIDANLAPV